MPQQNLRAYGMAAQKFINAYPDVSLQTLCRKHADDFLEKAFSAGSSKKVIRNLNLVCDTVLKFIREYETTHPEFFAPAGEEASHSTPESDPSPPSEQAASQATLSAPATGNDKRPPTWKVLASQLGAQSASASTPRPATENPPIAKSIGKNPLPRKKLGFFDKPPCPECGLETHAASTNPNMDMGFKIGGIAGALIAWAIYSQVTCPEHGHFEDSALSIEDRDHVKRQRAAQLFGGAVCGVLQIWLVVWLINKGLI